VLPTVSWLAEEYAALGVPFRRRGDLLDEHLRAWAVLWRDTPASFAGEHYSFRDVYFAPKAFRPGGPALWLGGAMTRAMWAGSAGRSCAGWTACCRSPAAASLCRMAQTPDDMLTAVSASLAERTGRPLAEWVALVRVSGIDPLDQNAVRKWLRSEHCIPQNSQWAIADAAARDAGWVRPTVAEYVDGQYSGAKAALRPVYDALAARLQPATAPGQATHKISLRSVQDLDDEVLHLLRIAYEQNA